MKEYIKITEKDARSPQVLNQQKYTPILTAANQCLTADQVIYMTKSWVISYNP
jgi:hypothetical protein